VRFLVLLLLLSVAPAAWSQAAGEGGRSALAVIDDCSQSASEETYGLTDLERECPGLTRALEVSGYLALLSDDVREVLHVYDLADLLQVDSWYAARQARDVDVETLTPVLASLREQEPERPLTWFERFKRWLGTLLERQSNDPDNWLSRWLDEVDVSAALVRTVLMGLIALIVVLAIAIVFNELRVAGLLRGRRGRRDAAVDATVAGPAAGAATDLEMLSADRKAPLLLRMLVTTLVQSGRLRTERSLTYRELCIRATFDDNEQREVFRRVAALAERTVYGGGAVPAEEVEPVVAEARALDVRLRGSPA
jgi:hypothetical protein